METLALKLENEEINYIKMTEGDKKSDYIPTASVELKCGSCSKFMGIIVVNANESSYLETMPLFEKLVKFQGNMGVLCEVCSVTSQKYGDNQRLESDYKENKQR